MQGRDGQGVRCAVGLSESGLAGDAAAEVMDAMGETLAGWSATGAGGVDLAVVWATLDHADELGAICEQVAEGTSAKHVVGATWQGVVAGQRVVESGPGLSVWALGMGAGQVAAFKQPGGGAWPIGDEGADQLRRLVGGGAKWGGDGDEPGGEAMVCLLADPFTTPMVKLLPAMDRALPGVPVVGGLLSGTQRPGQHRLWADGDLLTGGAVGFTLGDSPRRPEHHLDISTTVSQGCRPIGEPMVITKSKRHIVQELGGRNALIVVRELADALGDDEARLVRTQGLHVGRVVDEYKDRFGPGDFLIRGLVGLDSTAGYIAIGDPMVKVGQTIQFQVRDRSAAESDLELMLDTQRMHGPAAGALVFTCNGRGTRLFDSGDHDAERIADALSGAVLGGALAAGEIGPVGGESHVHGHAVSIAALRGE
ncbi:MAG: FIST N-terminal domain-containing protein [Planctomycetota bacterium]